MPNYLVSAEVLWYLIPGDKPEAASVKAWFDAADPERSTWTSAIGMAWVRSALSSIPEPHLRKAASDEFEQKIAPRYANRVLKLDDGVLNIWSTLRTIDEQFVARCSTEAALEAATAKHHGYVYVARRHPLFDAGNIICEDPWSPAG
jgi:predicted nucleic acid-binding protein